MSKNTRGIKAYVSDSRSTNNIKKMPKKSIDMFIKKI